MAGNTDRIKILNFNRSRKIRIISIFILLSVLMFCGCNQEVDSELRFSFTEVKPLIKKWDQAFGDHEVIPLFKDSSDKELYTISWVGINSKGDYFIYDGKARNIYQFDEYGKFIRTIGRQGQGPGEFDVPRFPVFDISDNLFVFDSGGRQILKFSSPDYHFEKGFKVGRYAQDFFRYEDGSFLIYSLYSMESNDVLFKISSSGEILRTAFTPKFKNFRIFISRFQIGGFEILEESNDLLFLYPYDYKLHVYDKDLNLKKILYPSNSSAYTPKGVPFPQDWNPYDFSPKIAKWWGKKLQPIVPFGLGDGMFLVEVAKYENFNTKSFINIHDINGNTYAEGLEVPHTIIRYSKNGYVYIVEDSSFDKKGNVTAVRLHRYKLTINKK